MNAGRHIHKSSFFITVYPHWLKNALIPMGETVIGVHGKKYRLLLKGDSKAIPRPPLVNASRMPWLADTRKKKNT
jgi:hypothetical protein